MIFLLSDEICSSPITLLELWKEQGIWNWNVDVVVVTDKQPSLMHWIAVLCWDIIGLFGVVDILPYQSPTHTATNSQHQQRTEHVNASQDIPANAESWWRWYQQSNKRRKRAKGKYLDISEIYLPLISRDISIHAHTQTSYPSPPPQTLQNLTPTQPRRTSTRRCVRDREKLKMNKKNISVLIIWYDSKSNTRVVCGNN